MPDGRLSSLLVFEPAVDRLGAEAQDSAELQVGSWRLALKGDRIEISHRVPRTVGADERAAIEAEVADIGRFMDRSIES